jgi:uncharacterized protein with PQ loop repeat
MQSSIFSLPTSTEYVLIAWAYLVTNGARVFTYLPQIIVVYRCTDGARSTSLLTWGSWVIGQATGLAYGILVVDDLFFTVISAINLVCCGVVTAIAAQRRMEFNARRAASGPLSSGQVTSPVGSAPLR